MLKKLLPASLVATLLLSGCLSEEATTEGEKEPTYWKMTHISDSSHLWHRTAIEFSRLVEEKNRWSGDH